MIEKLVLTLLKRLATKKAIERVAEALAEYLFENAVDVLEGLFIKIAKKLAAHTETNVDDKFVAKLEKDLKKKAKK